MAVSRNKGITWSTSVNVGAALSIANSVFPGRGRLAIPIAQPCSSFGSPTAGNFQDTANYKGILARPMSPSNL